MPLLQDVQDLSPEKYLRVQVLLPSRGFLRKSSSHPGIPSPLQFPATPLPQPSVASSLHHVFAGSNEMHKSCGGDVEEEDVVELDDSPGTTNGRKFSVPQQV